VVLARISPRFALGPGLRRDDGKLRRDDGEVRRDDGKKNGV
jgi:hypothetical protein